MPESEWTWSDVAKDVAPRTDTVELVLDGTVASALDKARASLAVARRQSDTLGDDAVSELETKVEQLEEQAQESVRTFTVRSIGHRAWRELVEAHPAKDPQERWNAATFIPAAIVAGCDQFGSEAEVDQALEVLSTGQVAKLFGKIRVLNEGDDRVPTLRGR